MKKVLWLILSVLLILPLVLSYPFQAFESINQPTTKFTFIDTYSSCRDTDIPSYNPFMRGAAITQGKSYWGFPIHIRHEDKCQGLFLLEETYCISNKVEKVIINCQVFGDYACFSGSCRQFYQIPGWDSVPHKK